ncbi:hypothetical protein ACRAWD_20140 [Caulobacter segnis]
MTGVVAVNALAGSFQLFSVALIVGVQGQLALLRQAQRRDPRRPVC